MDIPKEIWSHILSFVKNNNDKFYLLMTRKNMLECDFTFGEAIYIDKIRVSPLFNHFVHIVSNNFENLVTDCRKIEMVTYFKTNLFDLRVLFHLPYQYIIYVPPIIISESISHVIFTYKTNKCAPH